MAEDCRPLFPLLNWLVEMPVVLDDPDLDLLWDQVGLKSLLVPSSWIDLGFVA